MMITREQRIADGLLSVGATLVIAHSHVCGRTDEESQFVHDALDAGRAALISLVQQHGVEEEEYFDILMAYASGVETALAAEDGDVEGLAAFAVDLLADKVTS